MYPFIFLKLPPTGCAGSTGICCVSPNGVGDISPQKSPEAGRHGPVWQGSWQHWLPMLLDALDVDLRVDGGVFFERIRFDHLGDDSLFPSSPPCCLFFKIWNEGSLPGRLNHRTRGICHFLNSGFVGLILSGNQEDTVRFVAKHKPILGLSPSSCLFPFPAKGFIGSAQRHLRRLHSRSSTARPAGIEGRSLQLGCSFLHGQTSRNFSLFA